MPLPPMSIPRAVSDASIWDVSGGAALDPADDAAVSEGSGEAPRSSMGSLDPVDPLEPFDSAMMSLLCCAALREWGFGLDDNKPYPAVCCDVARYVAISP